MRLLQCLLLKNPCYNNGKLPRKGIVVHSTGANNPTLKRYVQPHAGQSSGMSAGYYEMLRLLGTNVNANDWNRAVNPSVCVHAFVGKLADGTLASVQTLPWEQNCWGSGVGSKGSYNSTHIQFEICEDTTDAEYTAKAFREAVELCAYLCNAYNIPVSEIVSHKEAHDRGYATAHVDPEHWFVLKGYSMALLRQEVQKLLDGEKYTPPPDYRQMLKERAGLEDKTLDWMMTYKYGADLIRKLATMK